MAQQSSQKVSCKVAFHRVFNLSVRRISVPPSPHVTTTKDNQLFQDSRTRVAHQFILNMSILHVWHWQACHSGDQSVVSLHLDDIILIAFSLRFQRVSCLPYWLVLAHIVFITALLSGGELLSAYSSNPILLTLPSLLPCFQDVSCHRCLFLQSHLAHIILLCPALRM